MGGVGGASGGTLALPGGGTIAGGIVGSAKGAVEGALIGAILGDAISDATDHAKKFDRCLTRCQKILDENPHRPKRGYTGDSYTNRFRICMNECMDEDDCH